MLQFTGTEWLTNIEGSRVQGTSSSWEWENRIDLEDGLGCVGMRAKEIRYGWIVGERTGIWGNLGVR